MMGVESDPSPWTPRGIVTFRQWKPVPEDSRHFSTGIPKFDSLLGGGYPRAAVVVFEIEPEISLEEQNALIEPTLLNFLGLDRGIIAVLGSNDTVERFKARMLTHVPPDLLSSRVRVADYYNIKSDDPMVLPMSVLSRDGAVKLWSEAERAVSKHSERPYIEYTNMDAIEVQQGDSPSSRSFVMGLQHSRAVGGLAICVLKKGVMKDAYIQAMADTLLRVHTTADGGVAVTGVRPRIGTIPFSPDPTGPQPFIKL